MSRASKLTVSFFIGFFILLACSFRASAAIGFDAQSSQTGNTNSLTWSHTVGAGSNLILLVGVSIRNSGGETVTGVTYAGNPLANIGVRSNGTSARVEIWRLVAPAAGINNITVTLSASARLVGGAVSLTGVDQTNPVDSAFVSNTGNSNAPSVTINTVADNAWVFDTLAFRLNPTATVGPGQTQRWNAATGGGPANGVGGSGSTEGPKTPPGAVVMNWTLSTVQDWAIGAVSLKPAAAFSGTIPVSVKDWKEAY